MPHPQFTIRVYALIINENNEILLSDEFVLNTLMTKFPGGGLEYGEGTIDCLHREAMEEMGLEIDITGHFYTTDFFQQALFYENTQLISIYYKATLKEPHLLKTSTKKHDFDMKEGSQSFRWVNVQTLSTSELSFPIDQKVLQLLQDGIRIKIGVDQSL
jgi:8-oxo-dGTP pyrophosphatase MutT (NUDIX family)